MSTPPPARCGRWGRTIVRDDDRARWRVWGVGVGGLLQPATALDMGNSGTSTRLLMGLVASHPITATFIGDASLSARPMGAGDGAARADGRALRRRARAAACR